MKRCVGREKKCTQTLAQQTMCLPPKAKADVVGAMEETLDVSRRPSASSRPLVCIDDTSTQQGKETREPLPSQPGKPPRDADADARNGVSHRCMIFAPLEGWRQVQVTDRRTHVDWAHGLTDLVDGPVPHAGQSVLMADNLHTHTPAALSEVFAPQAARRIIENIAWHHTPTHGRWLDRAESELRGLQRPGLDRRLPDQATLKREVAAWEHQRHQDAVKAHYQQESITSSCHTRSHRWERLRLSRVRRSVQENNGTPCAPAP